MLYLLAGSAGINPVMLILSIFLLMAWKVAGSVGLDRAVPSVIRALSRHRAKQEQAVVGFGTTSLQNSVPGAADPLTVS